MCYMAPPAIRNSFGVELIFPLKSNLTFFVNFPRNVYFSLDHPVYIFMEFQDNCINVDFLKYPNLKQKPLKTM